MKNIKLVDLDKPIIKKILPLKQEKKEKVKKLKKVKIGFLILCVLFSLSLGFNIILFLNSLDNKISSNLGTDIICTISKPENQTYSIFYPSGILGGINYNQALKITNSSNTPQYVRIKATSNNNNIDLLNAYLNVSNDWTYKNYYYYLNKPIESLKEIVAFDKISFENTYTNIKTSVVTIQVESLDNIDLALNLWNTPDGWPTQ